MVFWRLSLFDCKKKAPHDAGLFDLRFTIYKLRGGSGWEEVFAGGEVVCGVNEFFEWRGGCGEGLCVAGGGVPAAHVAGDGVGDGVGVCGVLLMLEG